MDERAPTLVVVGTSAGGVEALTTLVGGCPKISTRRELDDGELQRYRCRVGHAYSAEGTGKEPDGAILLVSAERAG
jgi:hypothetical protein